MLDGPVMARRRPPFPPRLSDGNQYHTCFGVTPPARVPRVAARTITTPSYETAISRGPTGETLNADRVAKLKRFLAFECEKHLLKNMSGKGKGKAGRGVTRSEPGWDRWGWWRRSGRPWRRRRGGARPHTTSAPATQHPVVYPAVPGQPGSSGLRPPAPQRPQTARRTGGQPLVVEASGRAAPATPSRLSTARRNGRPPMNEAQRAAYWEQVCQAAVEVSSESD